jgi:flagellar hook-associated protein 1 FlgK
MESYLHAFIGSVGIDSQSIKRSREFNEVIVNKLNETRDNISAVSIDEEMTNLIKYQHAYAAAAKLITTADDMLKTLLEVK